MGPIGDDIRVILLHPSPRFNLRCAHCHSSSSPAARHAHDVEAIEQLLVEAAEEEFNAIGVSGGEPLPYAPLPNLLRTAKQLRYIASVTTNGIPFTLRRLDSIAPYVALIAISLDGVTINQ